MTELDKNLNEVIELAAKVGERVVTVECPCCHKLFYALASEAAYQYDNPADQSTLKLKHLGRKCPHCGFAGGFDQGRRSKFEQDIEQMKIEMEAEKLAEEAVEKRQTPWSQICNQGLNFGDKKDD
jgi:glutaredoxin